VPFQHEIEMRATCNYCDMPMYGFYYSIANRLLNSGMFYQQIHLTSSLVNWNNRYLHIIKNI